MKALSAICDESLGVINQMIALAEQAQWEPFWAADKTRQALICK